MRLKLTIVFNLLILLLQCGIELESRVSDADVTPRYSTRSKDTVNWDILTVV